MTGVQIRVEVDAKDAIATVRKAQNQIDNPREMFDAIGLSLVASTQQRFERGVTPDGNPWPQSIRARLEGGQTLIESARLMQSVTHEPTDRSVAVGTNAIYGAVHQLGAVIVPVNAPALHFKIGGKDVFTQRVEIPARPYLGLDNDDEADVIGIAEDFIGEPFNAR